MEKIRKCNICEVTSQSAEFYKGVTSRCKECHKEKVRANRAENLEYYRAYDAKRFREDPRVLERHKAYQQTEPGKAAQRKGRENWLLANEEKRAAHIILGNAVKAGRIAKPAECEKCGDSPNRLHGHHDDYAFPLDVRWLCAACHRAWHVENGESPNG
jgi:hypothetical protein